MPDDDTVGSALAMLRGLPAERAEEEAAERATVPDSEPVQAVRALLILEQRRPWSLDDRRGLGLPPSVDGETWQAAVRARVSALAPSVVLNAWLDMADGGEGYRTREIAAEAMSRLTWDTAIAERVASLLHRDDTVQTVAEVFGMADVHPHETLLRSLRRVLVDPETTSRSAYFVLEVCAKLAHREPAVAALIAERLRTDRDRWQDEIYLPLSTPRRTIGAREGARIVERSRCASLAATAMLELERYVRVEGDWARALVAVAGDAGKAHLVRMRSRPGWSSFSTVEDPAVSDLDALVSPISDARHHEIESLLRRPRPDRLCALLLAVELDRHVVRDRFELQWNRPEASEWLPILTAQVSRLGRRALLGEAIAATMTAHALVELVDIGAAREPMSVEQELTEALRELRDIGAAEYAKRHIPDPRLTGEERLALDAAEAELAASAARWWG